MPTRAETNTKAAELRAKFEAMGAVPVEPPILQSAETLLDLYGEDIRGRAYVTQDALRGEMMLRPDFTVPVVQMHMADGAEPARYTYAGEVFRRQEHDPSRASEYVQVGFEIFDRDAPEAADAEVFHALQQAVAPLKLRAATGDIGILTAAVQGLETPERRKAALMRHIWRPKRFRTLLTKFAHGQKDRRPPQLSDAPWIGKRSPEEMQARLAALQAEAQEPPLPQSLLDVLDALLNVRETLPYALEQLRDIALDLPQISGAVERFKTRIAALSARGVDVDTLDFEASYGRTSMEYYDGFVFGFYAETRPDLPPVASGGRYDALTTRLGRGRSIPAVGGVIRPGLMLELGGKS